MKTELLQRLLADRIAKRPVAVVTNLASGEARLIHPDDASAVAALPITLADALRGAVIGDRSTTVEAPEGRFFVNIYNPPLRMCIVGAVHIAQPLARMAALTGYDVTVIDPRRSFATTERFPGVTVVAEWPDDALGVLKPDARTAIVTLTHDPKIDDPALGAALRSPAFYIGSLGSRKTHAARLKRLEMEGFGEAELARIHGPVGLDIAARSPAEIAVSILGQVTERLRRTETASATPVLGDA